jgi:hypothetical protein
MIEIVLWWAALTVCELMLISAVDRYELLAAVGLGLAGGLVATFARTAQPSSWRLRFQWLGWLPLLPVRVVADTARVLLAAARGETGSWRDAAIAHAQGDDAGARGARAVGAIAMSLAPGSVVLDVNAATGVARLHALGSVGGSRLEQAVAR